MVTLTDSLEISHQLPYDYPFRTASFKFLADMLISHISLFFQILVPTIVVFTHCRLYLHIKEDLALVVIM